MQNRQAAFINVFYSTIGRSLKKTTDKHQLHYGEKASQFTTE